MPIQRLIIIIKQRPLVTGKPMLRSTHRLPAVHCPSHFEYYYQEGKETNRKPTMKHSPQEVGRIRRNYCPHSQSNSMKSVGRTEGKRKRLMSEGSCLLRSKGRSVDVEVIQGKKYLEISIKGHSNSHKKGLANRESQETRASQRGSRKCPHSQLKRRSNSVSAYYSTRHAATSTNMDVEQDTGSVRWEYYSPADRNRTSLSQEALLEEVIYLRNLTLRLLGEKEKGQVQGA